MTFSLAAAPGRVLTGVLLVAVPAIFTIGFSGLSVVFDYPAILKRPAAEVLARFAAGGLDLHLYWYAMTLAAMALVVAALGLGTLFRSRDPFGASLVAGLGVVAGLVQALGLLRWTVLVPSLAATATDASASATDQALARAGFEMANAYLGAGVGEHLGYAFTTLFTLALARLLWPMARGLALAGAAFAIGVAVGMVDITGLSWAAPVNALAYMGWALWLMVVGGWLLWRRAPISVALAVPA